MELLSPNAAPAGEGIGNQAEVRPPAHVEGGQIQHAGETVPAPEHQERPVQQPTNSAPPVAQQPASSYPSLPAPVEPSAQATPVAPLKDAPLVAGDDELIERAWVTKAKKIIEETRSDPYKQESEISKLQADYLKKRYGKDVKLASD